MKSLAAAIIIAIPMGLAIESHFRWKAQEHYGQLLLESMDRMGKMSAAMHRMEMAGASKFEGDTTIFWQRAEGQVDSQCVVDRKEYWFVDDRPDTLHVDSYDWPGVRAFLEAQAGR